MFLVIRSEVIDIIILLCMSDSRKGGILCRKSRASNNFIMRYLLVVVFISFGIDNQNVYILLG